MVKIVEAFRFGVEEPPVWRVWTGHWEEVRALGEQVFHGKLVNIVEKGTWNQSMRTGPGTLPLELKRIRGGR
jgi:hypothetical protein